MEYRDALFENADSKRALVFFGSGLVVWLIEISFALYMSHLGLIMYSLLTVFRLLTIGVSLSGTALANTKRTLSFSYGFGRIETLIGFASCLLTVFGSGYVFMDALFEILFEPAHPERHPSPGVIPFAMVGLMVNMAAIFFFSKEIQPHIELRHSGKGNSRKKIEFVFSYIMDDLLSCSAVVLATWISSWGSVFVAEPFSALICGFLLLRAVKPYAQGYIRVLLQSTPETLKSELNSRLREAATIPGVLEIRDEHFWTWTPGVFVGSVKVRASNVADVQDVLANVHRLLSPIITHLTINVEKENWDIISH